MFDVIIPTYQNLDELLACLQGFSRQTYPGFRILLCIDGQPDVILRAIQDRKFPFDLLALYHLNKKQHGRNPTRNLALKSLSSPFLLMLDSDFVPDPDLLNSHASLLEKQDCLSIGQLHYTAHLDKKLGYYIQSRGKDKFKDRAEIPVQYFNTGNVAFRTPYFIDVGGQDPAMVTYGGGDVELGYRLQQTYHLPLIYNASACAAGKMNKTLPQVLHQLQEFGAINLPYMRQKHPEFTSYFRVDLLEKHSLKAWFIRCLMNPVLKKLMQILLKIFPIPLSNLFYHYLFFYHILSGYRKYQRGA